MRKARATLTVNEVHIGNISRAVHGTLVVPVGGST